MGSYHEAVWLYEAFMGDALSIFRSETASWRRSLPLACMPPFFFRYRRTFHLRGVVISVPSIRTKCNATFYTVRVEVLFVNLLRNICKVSNVHIFKPAHVYIDSLKALHFLRIRFFLQWVSAAALFVISNGGGVFLFSVSLWFFSQPCGIIGIFTPSRTAWQVRGFSVLSAGLVQVSNAGIVAVKNWIWHSNFGILTQKELDMTMNQRKTNSGLKKKLKSYTSISRVDECPAD